MKFNKFCPNKSCEVYGRYLRGNIILFGKDRNDFQRYKCTSCLKTFSERKNTPSFYEHLDREEMKQICLMLARKMSYRKIAKATDRHLDTIRTFGRRIMRNSRKFKTYFLEELKISPSEIKEMWKTLRKKTKLKQQPLKTE